MNVVDDGLKQELMVDVLRQHGRCRMRVSGTSMLPTLWPGDTVAIEGRSQFEMKVGDIVLYERCGRLFLHRLVALPAERFPGRLVTRGDSMPQADPAVRIESVLGVLTGVRRGEDWVALPGAMPPMTRLAATLLARSSGLVRMALYIASNVGMSLKQSPGKDASPGKGSGSLSRGHALPEVPSS
jgi:hypothetical protein